jgi:hypothetical protein
VTPKREGRDDDGDAETIDVRELGTPPRFRDRQYGIRNEGDTLMIRLINVNGVVSLLRYSN